jgi:hypothetical protein
MSKKWIVFALCVLFCGATAVWSYGFRERPLLIVGCARSGTTYMAEVLRAAGWKIQHERVKRDGAVSWELVFDDTQHVPWGSARKGRKFAHTFHQVRHPLRTISTVYHAEEPLQRSWDYIQAHIPEISPQDSLLVKSAKYWYYWNLKAEAMSEWTYQLENFGQVREEFERRVGKRVPRVAIESVPRNINASSPHHQFTWEELQQELDPELYDNIRHLAEHYGYKL